MSITDELREYFGKSKGMFTDHVLAIADRIDAEHERAMAAAALIAGIPMTDENMAEHGWIRLPVDANGEYIRIGDVVDVMPTDKFTGHKNVVVTSVIFKRSAVLVTVDTDDRPFTFRPNRIRHYHTPTVEDLIRDAILGCIGHSPEYWDEPIAECAAKLQLKEGE